MRRLRELLLWAGAALGLLAVAAGLAVTFFGFSFLIFRSGSMSPQIPTGGIALSRTVGAADIEPGDVVSVTAANGDRITHRVVSSTLRGDEATLVLKGDANASADSELYVVTSVERVVASLPYGGYVVAHALTPPGLLAMACLSLMLLVSGSKRDEDDSDGPDDTDGTPPAEDRAPGGRHRGPRRFAVASLVAATVVTGTGGTLAAFTDVVRAPTSTFDAASIATPAAPSTAQASALNQAATVTWATTNVGPNGVTASSYDILRYTSSTGGTASVICASTTTRSCTDPTPPILVTYYYSVRAKYGANWATEGPRQVYTPSLIAPTLSNSQPTSGTTTGTDMRASLNCPNAAPACGTVSISGASVTYTFTRVAKRGAECWTGALWIAGTTCTGTGATTALVTGTTWAIPGTEDVAWPSGDNDRGTYTLKVTTSNAFGSNSQTITVTIV